MVDFQQTGVIVRFMIGIVIVSLVVVGVIVAGVRVLLQMVFREMEKIRQRDAELNAEIIGTIAGVVQSAVTETVEKVVATTVKVFLGEPGLPTPQPEMPAITDLLAPDWTTWETDNDLEDVGVGDSVYFDRVHRQDAMLVDGESIIPGVPLPDMSGEDYHA